MTELALELIGVNKAYKHFQLRNLNLELPKGQIMGLIGANGAGKSTCMRILMGLVHQDSGVVRVMGHEMPSQQVQAKQEIGFLSEDMRLYGQSNLRWHMDFIASIFPSWDDLYAQNLCDIFDLNTDQAVKGFSHGQRVKAGLVLALARRPKLLILDEPTTGLDAVARYEVLTELMEVIRDEENTILFSSHNTYDVEKLSDTICFIDQGQLVASNDKERFLDQWRRIRIKLPQGTDLPDSIQVVNIKGSGQERSIITNSFSPDLVSNWTQAGLEVIEIEHLSLEEIFIAAVQKSRRLKEEVCV